MGDYFDWDEEEYDEYESSDFYDDTYNPYEEDEWQCQFPGECLMAFTDHMADECHTAEMYEAFMRECVTND